VPFRPATIEERRRYYREEWSVDEVPGFILDTLSRREFGFDHDGQGPRDRYNVFTTPEALETYLKDRAPFAAYSSVSLYKNPAARKGWEKAELIFDIDAKDLPVKNCCGEGEVCRVCLERARQLVIKLDRTLKEELCLEDINYVYSGRGYHIRILDGDVVPEGDPLRASILDYVRGNVPVVDQSRRKAGRDQTIQRGGYTGIFKSRLADIIQYAEIKDLRGFGISAAKANDIIEHREDIIRELEAGEDRILRGITKAAHGRFLERAAVQIASFLDAKVTVDVKRILRLPSSLHSKVSMKCVWVRDITKFDPLRDAVPGFVEKE
ncbi:MAG: DNA primase catalytic subunit PriS, partial [Euryarchaeota archaeon]|nr:DNA primase catalytic subunit PriS [Euryarchaeota archaeon]